MASRAGKKDDGTGGDMPNLPSMVQGKMDTSAGQAVDGQQGGGSPLSGGGGGAGGSGHGGGGGAPDDPAVTAGFYGGGVGNGMPGGVPNEGASGSGVPGKRGGANTSAAGNGRTDLRQFLPGGKFDPQRGLAGAAGPDGITGPHSNIWEKVQNRYKVLSPTLMP